METTWKIKPAARWHDSTRLTTEDLLFTATVEQDKEIPFPPWATYSVIENISAPDSRTVTVTWKRPYIEADAMFGYRSGGLPLPRHVLETTYLEDKGSFAALPYWNEEFVGAGAFKVREWARDSHVVLRANDAYILGRPRIDEIEIKFLPDSNALAANILAGVDVTLGKALSPDLALPLQEQWKEGQMVVRPLNWTLIAAQHINPNPQIVTDPQFRRALLHALDRQQLADFIFAGHAGPADSFVSPEVPLYDLIEPHVARYTYDPRLAAQMIGVLGYTKRPDGFFYDGAGQRLSVSIWTTVSNALQPKTTAAVADYWQQLGVAVEQVPVPIQRMQDREYRAQFPSFELVENPNTISVRDVRRFHSSRTPLPENRYTISGNYARYRNADLDALIERYETTIPLPERMMALGGVVGHLTENLPQMAVFFGFDPTMVANRVTNVTAQGDNFTQAWNAQEWDIKS
jgi:ABC-type transport system substrate-binding protein